MFFVPNEILGFQDICRETWHLEILMPFYDAA